MKIRYLLALLLASTIMGCGKDEDENGTVCLQVISPGIAVYVFDKETNSPISCNSSVVIGDGSYTETITEVSLQDGDGNCVDEGPLEGAFERAGSYTVIVSKEGYQDFIATDVNVIEDVCGVITLSIEAHLSK